MNDTTMNDTEPVDTRDMCVVHTALLREIRWAPAAVDRATGSARRRARVAGHLRLVLDLLEHHHRGEDELLLPLLRARVTADARGALDTGEAQHERIETLIAAARTALGRWAGADVDGEELSQHLTALHADLEPHLRGEERDILPLAAAHLSVAEWEAIGEAGARSTPRSALVLLFGMFLHEGDRDVVRAMLAHAPAPVRVLLPRIAPHVHAWRCRRVHGTARP